MDDEDGIAGPGTVAPDADPCELEVGTVEEAIGWGERQGANERTLPIPQGDNTGEGWAVTQGDGGAAGALWPSPYFDDGPGYPVPRPRTPLGRPSGSFHSFVSRSPAEHVRRLRRPRHLSRPLGI